MPQYERVRIIDIVTLVSVPILIALLFTPLPRLVVIVAFGVLFLVRMGWTIVPLIRARRAAKTAQPGVAPPKGTP